jgi:hypothetical protein
MRWNVNIATLAHCSLNNLAERAEAFLLCDEESDLDLSIRDCMAEVELCLTFRQAGGHHSFHRVRQALPVWNVSTAAPIAGRTLVGNQYWSTETQAPDRRSDLLGSKPCYDVARYAGRALKRSDGYMLDRWTELSHAGHQKLRVPKLSTSGESQRSASSFIAYASRTDSGWMKGMFLLCSFCGTELRR